jgi:hypothetical protein
MAWLYRSGGAKRGIVCFYASGKQPGNPGRTPARQKFFLPKACLF